MGSPGAPVAGALQDSEDILGGGEHARSPGGDPGPATGRARDRILADSPAPLKPGPRFTPFPGG